MTNLNKIVEMLAKQALGNANEQNQPNAGQQQANSSSSSGLGGILGSVIDQIGKATQQNNHSSTSGGGLGGVLGSVLGQLGAKSTTSKSSGVNAKSLLIMVLPLVLAWIQKQGGIQGALDKLKGQGLNRQVDDWVSTGPGENAAVDPQQVQQLFDDQEIEQVAQDAEAPKQDVYQAISKVLPQIIDALTPQGENTNKQEANGDIQNVMNLVSGFLKR